jgi:hypothetical protein
MRSAACLPLFSTLLLACSGSDQPAAESTSRASCEDAPAPEVISDTSTAGDDTAPAAGSATYPGPCIVSRDANVDGTPDAVIRYRYNGDQLSSVAHDTDNDGTDDETHLYSYEQGRVVQRTELSAAGALLRTLRYFHDEDGQLSHVDVHGADDALITRNHHMHLLAAGITVVSPLCQDTRALGIRVVRANELA